MKKELFTLSEKIKALRESLSLTQADLAKSLGLTRSAVNAWEMGLSIPSTSYIVELARVFNVSTDYLLGLNENAGISVAGLTEEQVNVLSKTAECFRKLNK